MCNEYALCCTEELANISYLLLIFLSSRSFVCLLPGYHLKQLLKPSQLINPHCFITQNKTLQTFVFSRQLITINNLQDMAGVDLHRETSLNSSILAADQPGSRFHSDGANKGGTVPRLLHVVCPETESSAITTSSCMNGVASVAGLAMEENGKLEHESHLHRLTSPIIADLPLMSMRSPPLSLDFTASEVNMEGLEFFFVCG